MTATERPPTAIHPPAVTELGPSRATEGARAEHAVRDRPGPTAPGPDPRLPARAPAPCPASSSHPADTSELRFSATPRGARLARRLASLRVHEWGHPYGSAVNDAVTLVVAELAANAVTHGRVPGRDALLRLTRSPVRLLVEVADTGDGQLPTDPTARPPVDAETGRGLMLVGALAEQWGVTPRDRAPGKTVWAVVGTALP